MSDDAPPKKPPPEGLPAWMGTFADLMSLLMCFFVLLLSFSEMDLLKFKQIAGSMKFAFGVQREIDTDETPKGTSIIAQEFSPGRPTPTVMEEIRQSTIDETRQTLDFTDAVNERESDNDSPGEDGEGIEFATIQKMSKNELTNQMEEMALMEQMGEALDQADAEQLKKLLQMQLQAELSAEELDAEVEKEIEELLQKAQAKTAADAEKLLEAFKEEIAQGLVNIEATQNRILIRIREKGSFPSGSATVKGSFVPVMNKLRDNLETISGRIIVAGHTDNIPIRTRQFRSNWELSSARAVTVVHELLKNKALNQERFLIEGHGEANPLVNNKTSENRALNRRVEITIEQTNGLAPTKEKSMVDTNEDIASSKTKIETT